MKNSKLNLDELKVSSFVTSEEQQKHVKGGIITLVTFFFVSDDEGCPKYSEAVDCTISA